MQDPELLVPESERPAPTAKHRPWVVVLARVWIVLALFAAYMVLAGNGTLKEATLTLAGFALVWCLVDWIARPLSQNRSQR